ncbi:MAG: thioredoxin [Candidatus Nealsonbacteria bacterium RIFOXYB1_FULL_40_15]|uniref:Thioredoxin n=2 Tax=Candidatus Nealsoniibacteriota TaxID=1817911 RepID=A0A1G2EU43_9BACT|nr:MAG: thioredoxin [Candidatus Nealsonbacteria bacterium RIFOXYB1_FULL_40_15]OGZ28517.1 MAG: thioredoxin [Candidatus Nealsonbacteria bacterium RIFOXYD1_FULL_39_11]OGZ28798.1 MAG: thioredoxin [Candidatus Nealsonbacteria bacterium RIFOXYC1_FULL_40_7]
MIFELKDQNFESEINNAGKPILVDFYADWCQPCRMLAPILEKIAGESEEFVLMKANLDEVPLIAQKFGIDQIPTVILFKEGKPVSGFLGLRPESAIKEWLSEFIKDDISSLISESEKYAEDNGFILNPDREAVKRIATGIIGNKKKYGKKYCPCRRITGTEEDEKKTCPCYYHKNEIKENGHCLCLFYFKK